MLFAAHTPLRSLDFRHCHTLSAQWPTRTTSNLFWSTTSTHARRPLRSALLTGGITRCLDWDQGWQPHGPLLWFVVWCQGSSVNVRIKVPGGQAETESSHNICTTRTLSSRVFSYSPIDLSSFSFKSSPDPLTQLSLSQPFHSSSNFYRRLYF